MIANCFNNYFADIGPTLASKICTDNVSRRDFILQGINASLVLEPKNHTEIKLIIGQLKEGASGRDGIMPRHIECVSESIAYPLTRMANLSFEQGVFPAELKLANITPIYKAKDPMFFNNYRPISLLSVFSKILERLMYNRVLRFINRYNLFNKYQFGFRNKHSTFMALIIHDKSSWWWKMCYWNFSRFPKGFWHCWSLYPFGQTLHVWYTWHSPWLVCKLLV